MIAPRGGEGQLAYRAGMTYARESGRSGRSRIAIPGRITFHAKTVCVDCRGISRARGG